MRLLWVSSPSIEIEIWYMNIHWWLPWLDSYGYLLYLLKFKCDTCILFGDCLDGTVMDIFSISPFVYLQVFVCFGFSAALHSFGLIAVDWKDDICPTPYINIKMIKIYKVWNQYHPAGAQELHWLQTFRVTVLFNWLLLCFVGRRPMCSYDMFVLTFSQIRGVSQKFVDFSHKFCFNIEWLVINVKQSLVFMEWNKCKISAFTFILYL